MEFLSGAKRTRGVYESAFIHTHSAVNAVSSSTATQSTASAQSTTQSSAASIHGPKETIPNVAREAKGTPPKAIWDTSSTECSSDATMMMYHMSASDDVLHSTVAAEALSAAVAPVTTTSPPKHSIKRFCIGGSPKPEHYQLQLLHTYEGTPSEWTMSKWLGLCDVNRWFMVVGQRQAGKSSSCRELRNHLNGRKGLHHQQRNFQYAAFIVDLSLMNMPLSLLYKDVKLHNTWQSEWLIVDESLTCLVADKANLEGAELGSTFDATQALEAALAACPGSRFETLVSLWAKHLRDKEFGRKLVLILDEYDSIQGNALNEFFCMLRGVHEMDSPTASSVILVGHRDHNQDQGRMSTCSPFNIISEVILPQMFGFKQIEELFNQHTMMTGQTFAPDVCASVLHWTGGQPWLVNKVGELVCFGMDGRPARDEMITVDHIIAAVSWIVKNRSTHIEHLEARLQEERVLTVLTALEQNRTVSSTFRVGKADRRYAEYLGLLRQAEDGQYHYANKIYECIIPRVLDNCLTEERTYSPYTPWQTMPCSSVPLTEEGDVDLHGLLDFFVERCAPVVGQLNKTAATQEEATVQRLMLIGETTLHVPLYMFLAGVLNVAGLVIPESSTARGAVNFHVKWPIPKPQYLTSTYRRALHDLMHFSMREHILEVKYWRPSSPGTMTTFVSAVRQAASYAHSHGRQQSSLFVFDMMDKSFCFDPAKMQELNVSECKNVQSNEEGGFRCIVSVPGAGADPAVDSVGNIEVHVRVHYIGALKTASNE